MKLVVQAEDPETTDAENGNVLSSLNEALVFWEFSRCVNVESDVGSQMNEQQMFTRAHEGTTVPKVFRLHPREAASCVVAKSVRSFTDSYVSTRVNILSNPNCTASCSKRSNQRFPAFMMKHSFINKCTVCVNSFFLIKNI